MQLYLGMMAVLFVGAMIATSLGFDAFLVFILGGVVAMAMFGWVLRASPVPATGSSPSAGCCVGI